MEIYYTNTFKSEIKKFLRKNPKYRKKVAKTVNILANDPRHPSLRLHKITKGKFSISVDMRIRILISFEGEKIILHVIGNHDEVYI